MGSDRFVSAGQVGGGEGSRVVPEWVDRAKKRPWVAHVVRAVERFNARLGSEFGAAITYFSTLALIPILMLAFSISGFVLTWVRPDLLTAVAVAVAEAIGSADETTRAKILALAQNALSNYTAIGIVGLLTALYSGAGWMGNLKNAVRAQWRASFDVQEASGNIVVKTLVNLVTMLGLIVAMVVTFGLASISTSLTNAVLGWLGLSSERWLAPLLHLLPVIFSVGAGWLLFVYLYTVLPETREPWPVVRRGALLGAVGLAVLQYLTSFLVGLFSHNPAAALFGPVITLMLFFNLFSQLILFVAAWIATARREAVEVGAGEERVRFAPDPEGAASNHPAMVPEQVAVRSVRIGLGAGYLTGAATGAGLGAVLAYLFSAAVRGRKSKPSS
jgi:membrane protein